MGRNKLIFWINDDKLIVYKIKTKDKFIETFKSLKNDIIIDNNLFLKEFSKFLKKNKIKITIFGYKIIVLKNNLLTQNNQNNLKNILTEYFSKIKFIDISSYLNNKKDEAYINLTDNFVDYIYKDKYLRVNKNIFCNNTNNIIKHLITTIYKPKQITIFGNTEVPNVAKNIYKKLNIKTIFSENYQTYFLELYLHQNIK